MESHVARLLQVVLYFLWARARPQEVRGQKEVPVGHFQEETTAREVDELSFALDFLSMDLSVAGSAVSAARDSGHGYPSGLLSRDRP